MDSQNYLELCIPVPDEQTGDIVVAMVGELGYDSFIYEDGVQKCYIQESEFDAAALENVMQMLADMLLMQLHASWHVMPAVNWNSRWEQEGFTPIECGDFAVVPASGAEDALPGDMSRIYLKPEMAFGTGHHHTTYMMMLAMQRLKSRIQGASVMDLGCGTAVLAILAAKLGAARVSAIDIDAVAVRSAMENVRLNVLDFPVICGDASNLDTAAYDVILANIHRNIIIADMERYVRALRPGGLLLVSGFLQEDVPPIIDAACMNGFALCGEDAISFREGWYQIDFELKQN